MKLIRNGESSSYRESGGERRFICKLTKGYESAGAKLTVGYPRQQICKLMRVFMMFSLRYQ